MTICIINEERTVDDINSADCHISATVYSEVLDIKDRISVLKSIGGVSEKTQQQAEALILINQLTLEVIESNADRIISEAKALSVQVEN